MRLVAGGPVFEPRSFSGHRFRSSAFSGVTVFLSVIF